jgi:rare lipoprotein A
MRLARLTTLIAGALALFVIATMPGAARDIRWALAHIAPEGPCAGRLVFATWYAIGRRTASGEMFSSSGFTAAHRTLPFGSRVTVQNPRTNQSVTVSINDRGPRQRGVEIDLSRGAAVAIGMRASQWVCLL